MLADSVVKVVGNSYSAVKKIMISSVSSLLNFDGGCIPDREFLLVGQNGANGSFLLHHAVASSVKEGRGICLLSFVQKFHHYNSVAQKVGVNLQTGINSNQLVFIDGLDELSKAFSSDENTDNLGLSFLSKMKTTILETLLVVRKARTLEPIIVIDDVTVLLSMGIHVDDVQKFVNSILWEAMYLGHPFSLRAPSTQLSGGCTGAEWANQASDTDSAVQSGASLAVLCSYTENDRDSVGLWKFLSHLCSLEVDVRGLQTGYCKDVHGQVSVTWRDKIDTPRAQYRKRLQFKLTDSGVSFFAAGMSAAVL